MRHYRMRVAATAVAALTATSLAACASSSTPAASSTGSSAGTPVTGGTLRFLSSGDFDHIDPLSAYGTIDVQIQRAFARHLVSNPASNDYNTAISVVPDIATVVPTKANGGLSSDGLTYTFHLRPGVMWNSSPARAVVAGDFVREFKAMCNPVLGVGNPLYFVPVIAGMKTYCAAYAKVPATATAAQLAAFQNSHTISGVSAPNASTLVVKLVQPAERLSRHHRLAGLRRCPTGGIRQLPARQPTVPSAHPLRWAVRDHVLHPDQAGCAHKEPGVDTGV